MELLHKTYAQLADVVRSMTPGARLAAGTLLIVVLASLGYLLNQQVSPQQSYLLGGEMFSTSQLREIQMALGKAGLEATVEGARIKVPRGQESKYMAALAESSALPDFGGYLKKAVSGNGFMAYGPQQEARTKIAIQSELQLAISQMEGIESASVLIAQESRRGFREANIVTASVGVQPRGTGRLDEQTVAAIRSIVASAWAGLKPEAVTVVDLSGPRLFPGTGGGESKPGAVVGSYAQNKKQLELDWQEKIERLLAPMVAGALVTTNVELDPEVSNEERSAQITGPAREGQSPSAAPTTEKRIVREGRTPKRVTVSVAIPNTYYEEIWRKQRPPVVGGYRREPDVQTLAEIESAEKKKIETAILPLLGNHELAAGQSSQVAVTTFDPAIVAPLSPPTFRESAIAWLGQNWNTVGLGCLALVGLFLLRSMMKSLPAAAPPKPTIAREAPPPMPPRPRAVFSDEDEMDRAAATTRTSAPEGLRRRATAAATLRDQLGDVVREHPDSAVNLLRTWIGNAS
jgi:flagellar biosynthesis/type III secretory pathway M-ring protein FliF/YscJ